MRACHHGPSAVLKEVRRLRDRHPHVADLDQKVSYLCKREQHMGVTPLSRVGLADWQWQCWGVGKVPTTGSSKLGSKGPACGFQRSHVNPMLALRTAECSEQWEPAWLQTCHQRL